MQGVPIKFRGRCRYDGRYTYAEIVIDAEGVRVINDADGGHAWKVEPDSIQQLVGYDTDGEEIYEGDTVTLYDSSDDRAFSTSAVTLKATAIAGHYDGVDYDAALCDAEFHAPDFYYRLKK